MFFPLGHDTRIQRFPYVTVAIITLNVLVFIFSMIMTAGEERAIERKTADQQQKLVQLGEEGKELFYIEQIKERTESAGHEASPELQTRIDELRAKLTDEQKKQIDELIEDLKHFKDQRFEYRWGFVPVVWRPITMITYAFLHGGWIHIIGNMLFLWIFGTPLEDKWGPYVYSTVYLFGAVASCTLFGILARGLDLPLVGASGAIFAMCGAFMYRFPKSKVIMGYFFWIFLFIKYGKFNVSAWAVMLFYFADNALSLWIQQNIGMAGGGVAYAAHVGGFLFGLAVAVAFKQFAIEDKYLKAYDMEGEEHVLPQEFQTAMEQIAQKQPAAALVNLKATLTKDPNYLPALTEIYKIHLAGSDRGNAVEFGTRVVDGLLKLGEPTHAIEMYNKLLEVFPDASLKPAMQYRIADALVKHGQHREAAVAYRNLATNNPGPIAEKALLACGNTLTDKVKDHKNAMNVFRYLEKTYPQSNFLEYAKQGYDKAQRAYEAESPGINTQNPPDGSIQ